MDPRRMDALTDIATEPFRPSISMLGWALNEEDSLEGYVSDAEEFLRSVSDDFELVLIDDGSTDRTWAIACELQRTRPWLRLLKNDGNRGSGYCYRRAIANVTKDYFFAQTVDWAYDIRGLAESIDLLREFDVLQGVRSNTVSIRGILHRSDNLRKGIVSVVNYGLIRCLFRVPLSDYQNVTICPTRLMRTVSLEANSSFANPEVVLKAWWQGASFREVTVPFLKRERGSAKGTRIKFIVRSIADIWRWWFRWIVFGQRSHRGVGRIVRDI